MTTPITSNRLGAAAGQDHASRFEAAADLRDRPQERTGWKGAVEDGLLLMLVVFLFPLAILLVGAPLALFIRVVVEIVERLF